MESKVFEANNGSRFAGIPGIVVLAFFLVLSVYFRTSRISAFLLLFLVLCLTAYLWSRMAVRQLSGEVQALTPSCFPDEEIKLKLTLKNTGRLSAIWTNLYLLLPERGLVLTQDGEAVLRQKFVWLGPGQQLSCTRALTAKKRGIFSIDGISLQAGDGFGIGAAKREEALESAVTAAVYPRLYPVRLQSLMLRGNHMDTGKRGTVEDVTLLKNIRPYAVGDSFKRINWRMLARQQKLYVNLYEQITPESIVFLLDLKSFETTRHVEGEADTKTEICADEEHLESAISLAASCIVELCAQSVSCGLAIPEYAGYGSRFYLSGNRPWQAEEMLMLLAEIAYDGGDVLWPQDHLLQMDASMSQIYVIVNRRPDENLLLSDAAPKMRFICMQKSEIPEVEGALYASDLLSAGQGKERP